MNKKAPLRLTVPFKARKHLHECLTINPPTFKYERENFYWLVDTIISFSSVKDLDYLKGGSLVTVSSEYMDQHIAKGLYAKHMRYLEEIGIVEGDHIYCVEKGEAKGYMICVEYLGDIDIEKDKVFIHSSSSIWKAVEEYRVGKQSHKALPPHIKALKKCFNKTGFDYNGAKEFVLSMEIKGKNKDLKRRAYLKCIDNLEDKKHRYFNVSYSNGRLNSNYTNLLTVLRQFIKGDKIMIDLSNSQPYLLSQIFNSISRDMSYCSPNDTYYSLGHPVFKGLSGRFKNPPRVCPVEVVDFSMRCQNGTIYEYISDQMGIGLEKRKKVKKGFLAMLYSDNETWFYHEYEKVFKRLYPTLSWLTRHLKMECHSELALTMQRVESDVFIEGIGKVLTEMGVDLITIHDSIVISREDYNVALDVMKQIFQTRFGNIPNFKVTNMDGSVAYPEEELFRRA